MAAASRIRLARSVRGYRLDEWQADVYARSPSDNPVGGFGVASVDPEAVATRRVTRGGSWGRDPVNLRVANRDSRPPEGAGSHVGFRCARSTAA